MMASVMLERSKIAFAVKCDTEPKRVTPTLLPLSCAI